MPDIGCTRANRYRIRAPIQWALTQTEREDAVAIKRCLQAVAIVTGCRQDTSAPDIRATMAEISRVRLNIHRIHTQLQHINTITTVTAVQTVIIHSRFAQRPAAPGIHIRSTNRRHRKETMYRMHLQIKAVYAVTSMLRCQAVRVDAHCCEHTAAPRIGIAIAYLRRVFIHIGRIVAQHQGIHAVTTIDATQAVVIDADGSQRAAAPRIRRAWAHPHRVRLQKQGTLTQTEAIHTVAAVTAVQGVRVVSRFRKLAAVPHIRARMAEVRRVGERIGRTDSQHQRIHTVAAICAMQAVVIHTTLA